MKANTSVHIASYKFKYIGSTGEGAAARFCPDDRDLSNLNISHKNIFTPNPLQVGKVYQRTYKNKTYYYYIISEEESIYDRDALEGTFTLIDNICEAYKYPKEHKFKNLGSTFDQALQNLCKTNNHENLQILSMNIDIAGTLIENGVYTRNDNGDIYYLLITEIVNKKAIDRDTYTKSNFSNEPITLCFGQNAKAHSFKMLGTTEAQASEKLCSPSFNSLRILRFNLDSLEPLATGKIYKRILDGDINYIYIVSTSNTPERDRDTYPRSFFSNDPINILCDSDDDGIPDKTDNCPSVYNPNQLNNDSDSLGNACDNCPNNSNQNQSDIDSDGIGDVCDNDRDGDGVANVTDQCPNEPGSVQNNGCPNTGAANLQFEKPERSHFKSDCYAPGSGCAVSGHYIYKSVFSNGMDFDVFVRNEGTVVSETAYIHVYLWADNDPNVAFYKPKNNVFKLNPLGPGQQRPFIPFYFDDKGSFFNGGIPAGNYTLQIRIEQTPEGNSEFSTDISLPFQVRAGDPPTRASNLKNKVVNKPYEVNVYNVQGIHIAKETVSGKIEENTFVKSLPKGFYIIKNGKETYKIVKK